MPSLVDRVDAVLPQTQCTKCGYDGCRPYAEAIVTEGIAINRCPPGGARGISQLAALLDRPVTDLDPNYGVESPLKRAVIVESLCIGCTLCIDACPVDAIVGTARQMHSIITAHCTGCELCVAPCPMDCITMEVVEPRRDWTIGDADAARQRMLARKQRTLGAGVELDLRQSADTAAKQPVDRRAAIDAARERARARRGLTG